MIKNFCLLVLLSLASFLHCISADGVAVIDQPLPTQIDQVTLQSDDQDILLTGFNNLEGELNEASAILIELSELDNEWEWNAEWITESNEQILLITNDHGDEILVGSNSVTSNEENLEAVIVVAIGEAISEAINEAENFVEEAVQEAFENAGNFITEAIQNVANEVTESVQESVTEAITGSLSNVGNSLTGDFFGSNS